MLFHWLAASGVLVTTCLVGCDSSEEPERVQYRQQEKFGSDIQSIAVSRFVPKERAEGESPAEIVLPGTISAKAPLAFEGAIGLDSPEDSGGAMLVRFYEKDASGRNVIGNDGSGITTKNGSEATYRVELRSPARPGRYTVDVINSQGGQKPQTVIGRGEIEVK